MSVVFPAPAIPSTMHPTARVAGVDGVDDDEAASPSSIFPKSQETENLTLFRRA
jgi:hypothetical protein